MFFHTTIKKSAISRKNLYDFSYTIPGQAPSEGGTGSNSSHSYSLAIRLGLLVVIYTPIRTRICYCDGSHRTIRKIVAK